MRYPAVAGRFYPSDRDELISEIERCFAHPLGPGMISKRDGGRTIKGALVPHAGYACSGMNAAHAFRSIAEDGRPEAYIIIGPDHYGIPFDSALCSEPYMSPLGECGIHEDIAERLSETVADSPLAHALEHSIEAEVPFIQYIDPEAKIVPIIMHRQDIGFAEHIGKAIREACDGYDVVVIASSDLSHYIPKDDAERLDSILLDDMASLDTSRMYSSIRRYGISACGYGPIAAMISATRPDNCTVLKHTDSWDSIHYQRDAVVGYGSAVFR